MQTTVCDGCGQPTTEAVYLTHGLGYAGDACSASCASLVATDLFAQAADHRDAEEALAKDPEPATEPAPPPPPAPTPLSPAEEALLADLNARAAATAATAAVPGPA